MAPKTGRPRKGEGLVQDLPKITLRMGREKKELILATSYVTGRPLYELVGEAFAAFFEQLPKETQRAVRSLIAGWKRELPKTR